MKLVIQGTKDKTTWLLRTKNEDPNLMLQIYTLFYETKSNKELRKAQMSPEKPQEPGQPGQSTNIQGQPNQPGQTGQPGQPSQPGQPGQPGQTGQPGQPGQSGPFTSSIPNQTNSFQNQPNNFAGQPLTDPKTGSATNIPGANPYQPVPTPNMSNQQQPFQGINSQPGANPVSFGPGIQGQPGNNQPPFNQPPGSAQLSGTPPPSQFGLGQSNQPNQPSFANNQPPLQPGQYGQPSGQSPMAPNNLGGPSQFTQPNNQQPPGFSQPSTNQFGGANNQGPQSFNSGISNQQPPYGQSGSSGQPQFDSRVQPSSNPSDFGQPSSPKRQQFATGNQPNFPPPPNYQSSGQSPNRMVDSQLGGFSPRNQQPSETELLKENFNRLDSQNRSARGLLPAAAPINQPGVPQSQYYQDFQRLFNAERDERKKVLYTDNQNWNYQLLKGDEENVTVSFKIFAESLVADIIDDLNERQSNYRPNEDLSDTESIITYKDYQGVEVRLCLTALKDYKLLKESK
jgi:hypothetical protein